MSVPFSPTAFATPIVAPNVGTLYRRAPYISPSEYRFAPTAVATTGLNPGSQEPSVDSLSNLADVINRASGIIDEHCFHAPDGTLAASPSVESDWIKAKGDGSLNLICNFKPVIAVLGIAIGPTPSTIQSLNPTSPADIFIRNKVIMIPATYYNTVSGNALPFPVPTYKGGVFAVWEYVNGFAHATLTASCAANATTLTIENAVVGDSLYGIYPGTVLRIKDGNLTELVQVASVSGNTVTLTGTGTVNAHTLPSAPDFIPVTALPWDIEQACIFVTSALIKSRGSRAQILSAMAGERASSQAMHMAGASHDIEMACKALRSYKTVYMHA